MLDADAMTMLLNGADPPPRGGALPALAVVMANPRGFCAGVRRAIDAVEDALRAYGPPVYVRRPIVHNLAVVRDLEAKGALFVQELDEVPDGAVVILSAHGSPPQVAEEAARRGMRVHDAVCPLVSKVHREVVRHHRGGRHVLLIGHDGHPEIVGTLARLPPGAATVIADAGQAARLDFETDRPLGYAVQTTYSVEEAEAVVGALEARFADLAAPPRSDICYATSNRQAAVRAIAPRVDAMIVVGERFSSNACRLAEVARAAGCRSVQLVADAAQLDWAALPGSGSLGVTAAASTPEAAVARLLDALAARYSLSVEEAGGPEETVMFKPVRVG